MVSVKLNNICYYYLFIYMFLFIYFIYAVSALHTPYSQVCKDDVMTVNWPKHVVEVKIKIYYCVSLKPETIVVL